VAATGLPPHFFPNGAELGLDLGATPTFTEVCAQRTANFDEVRRFVAVVTPDELDRPCERFGQTFPVLGALQVVIFEEWAHHVYATRDLTMFESA